RRRRHLARGDEERRRGARLGGGAAGRHRRRPGRPAPAAAVTPRRMRSVISPRLLRFARNDSTGLSLRGAERRSNLNRPEARQRPVWALLTGPYALFLVFLLLVPFA